MRKYLLLIILFLFISNLPAAVRDGRGVWISRWEWTAGSESNQKRIIREAMQNARDANLNMIFFQIRGNADAFYQSSYEPWSNLLTGTWGQNPGWDPLEYAIQYAHSFGLELHAWLNTFPMWNSDTPPPTGITPEHMFNAHPEWRVCDFDGVPMTSGGGYIGASPGIPAVREHVMNVAMEIVNNYDVDGIHFDYIRYPENANTTGYSHDEISVDLFNSNDGNPQGLDWDNWQRENINIFVRDVYDSIGVVKPWVKMSAAVIGRYNWGSWNGYYVVFQDAKRWATEGKIDMIVPMAYMTMGQGFDYTIYTWQNQFSADRHLLAGIGAYLISWTEVLTEIDWCRTHQTAGEVFFSYNSITSHISELGNDKFSRPGLIPNLPWRNNILPLKPTGLTVQVESQMPAYLTWNRPGIASDGDSTHYYGIYRSESGQIDPEMPGLLLDVVPASDSTYFDFSYDESKEYYYAVTAFDLFDNESLPSNQVHIYALGLPEEGFHPDRFALAQNYPNPFNPATTIRYNLPYSSPVEFEVFTLTGEQVYSVGYGRQAAGEHQLSWQPDNLAGGIYFYRLRAGNWTAVRKMIYLK